MDVVGIATNVVGSSVCVVSIVLSFWFVLRMLRHPRRRKTILLQQLLHLSVGNFCASCIHLLLWATGLVSWKALPRRFAEVYCEFGDKGWKFCMLWQEALHLHIMLGVLFVIFRWKKSFQRLAKFLIYIPIIAGFLIVSMVFLPGFESGILFSVNQCRMNHPGDGVFAAFTCLTFFFLVVGYFVALGRVTSTAPNSVSHFVFKNAHCFVLTYFVVWTPLCVIYWVPHVPAGIEDICNVIVTSRGALEALAYFRIARRRSCNSCFCTGSDHSPGALAKNESLVSALTQNCEAIVPSFHVCFRESPDSVMTIENCLDGRPQQSDLTSMTLMDRFRDMSHFHLGEEPMDGDDNAPTGSDAADGFAGGNDLPPANSNNGDGVADRVSSGAGLPPVMNYYGNGGRGVFLPSAGVTRGCVDGDDAPTP
eukprot:TRINITY_DN75294_c0_g1_i1.p1 TRINITY_DN75294_c0_g1~~TRINITY_DN75294_c0_g1_i1.p1  ORF type:complete len:422 (-),score=49.16 TRINITY_DN75294_c0_g1_i1:36-1301(-)